MKGFRHLFNSTEVSAILEGISNKNLRHSVWLNNFYNERDLLIRRLYF